MKLLSALILLTACSTLGCAATDQLRRMSDAPVDASAAHRPQWLGQAQVFERDGFVFVVGSASRTQDLSQGFETADADAMADLLEAIHHDVRREALRQSGGASAATIDSLLNSCTADLHLRGMMRVDRYWERSMASPGTGLSYSYQVFQLLRIPRVEVERVRALALQDLMQKLKTEMPNARS